MAKKMPADLKALVKRVNKARDFPTNTTPASRHVQMIGEALAKGQQYPMLSEEPQHCAWSLLSTVAGLYEARTEIDKLTARAEQAEAALSVAQKDAGKHVATVYGAWTNHRSIDGNPDNQVVILTMKETNDLHDFLEAIAHGGAGEGDKNG